MAHWIDTAFKQWKLGKSFHPILGREFVISCPTRDYQNGIAMVESKWMGVRLSIWPESQQALKQIVTQRVRKERAEHLTRFLGD